MSNDNGYDEKKANAIAHAMIAGALTEEGAAVALDARSTGEIAEVADASSQVGLAPLDPYDALALANALSASELKRSGGAIATRNARAIATALSEFSLMDQRDKEQEGEWDAEWEAAWDRPRAKGGVD